MGRQPHLGENSKLHDQLDSIRQQMNYERDQHQREREALYYTPVHIVRLGNTVLYKNHAREEIGTAHYLDSPINQRAFEEHRTKANRTLRNLFHGSSWQNMHFVLSLPHEFDAIHDSTDAMLNHCELIVHSKQPLTPAHGEKLAEVLSKITGSNVQCHVTKPKNGHAPTIFLQGVTLNDLVGMSNARFHENKQIARDMLGTVPAKSR